MRKVGYAFVIALLASIAAPLIVNVPVIFVSKRVLAQTTDNRKQEADKLLEQGNKQLDTSQYKAALSSYQQALKIYQSIGDRNGEGISLGSLGNAYYSLGNYKQAINYHQQSLEIKRAIGDRKGDGVIGLPRAFISAGTPSIVVSLWRVSDESTAFFMPEFYQQLKIHNDKAIALRQAMLATMKKYPHPSDWSAFLLIGEAE